MNRLPDGRQAEVLVVDDDPAILLSLKVLLRRAGYSPVTAATPAEAVDAVRRSAPALAIIDMNYSRSTTGSEGIELLRRIKVLAPDTPVILMTAWGSIPLAVEGMKHGAADFVTKPWGDNARLLRTIATAIELAAPAPAPAATAAATFDRCGIIGADPALRSLLATVERVAPTDAPVLILGENGTGKELIARAIHANSPRARKPFVAVNLGGIPRELFESEMFGHVKGSFTGAIADREGRFAAADGGTIFLDEIGDLDPAAQVKMLRVLQEHTFEPLGSSTTRRVDIRVVAATNADLPAMVADGTFREDLFYRINLITLRVPPLRERPADIPLLVKHFADEATRARGLDGVEFSPEAMERLAAYPFPGNIRQLRNVVERAILVGGSRVVLPSALDLPEAAAPDGGAFASSTLDDTERRAVADAMARAGGNVSRAAAILGITRQTLYRRLRRYNLS